MARDLCLNWNNHASILNEFKEFLSTGTMVDVTLACEGKSLKAHKLILSACSPFFKTLLSENPCKHPIVVFQDIKYAELKAVIDFMYDGEVSVREDHLAATVKAADSLKVKILGDIRMGGDESSEDDQSETQSGDESKVQSDDDSEPGSGAASAVQSEDESNSHSGTASRFQTNDESEKTSIHPSTALSVAALKCRKGTLRKLSKSDSEISEPENEPSTEILSGDKTPPTPNLSDSKMAAESPSAKFPCKSLKVQQVEKSFKENIGSPPMPILEEMLIDERLPKQLLQAFSQSGAEQQNSPVSSRKEQHQSKLTQLSKEQQQTTSDRSSKECKQSSRDFLVKKQHKIQLELSSKSDHKSGHSSKKHIQVDTAHVDKKKLLSSKDRSNKKHHHSKLDSSGKHQHQRSPVQSEKKLQSSEDCNKEEQQNSSGHSSKKKNQSSVDHSKKVKHMDDSDHSIKKKHKTSSDHSDEEHPQFQNDLDSSDKESEEEQPQSSPNRSTLASRHLTPTSTMPVVLCEKLKEKVESNIIMECSSKEHDRSSPDHSSKEHDQSSPDHSSKEQDENGLICSDKEEVTSSPRHLESETQAAQEDPSDTESEEQEEKKGKSKRPYVRLDKFLESRIDSDDNNDPDFAMYTIEKTPKVEGVSSSLSDTSDGSKFLKCQKCPFKTRYTTSFKRHVTAMHMNLKKFKCEQCSYATRLMQLLKRHTREVHGRVKRFHCTLCPYKSAKRQQLRRHVESVHEHKQPYVCKLCSFRSSQKASVQKHITAIHEQKRDYTCSLCTYRSAQAQNLKRHLKTMHEDIIFCMKTDLVHDSDPDNN